jgi:hypothetical protein
MHGVEVVVVAMTMTHTAELLAEIGVATAGRR